MTMLQFVLSTLIRNGKVTVETPDIIWRSCAGLWTAGR